MESIRNLIFKNFILKINNNYFSFFLKKIYRFLNLHITPEVANFPFGRDSVIGFSKPFLSLDENEGFFTRYYYEHNKDCSHINSFFHLEDKHLFKNEILWGKRYSITYRKTAKCDLTIPISGFNNSVQKIDIYIHKNEVEIKNIEIIIDTQRFTYINLDAGETIEISSKQDFLVAKKINKTEIKKEDNLKLVLFLFVDGLYDFSKLGMQPLEELMPKTYKFFKKGTIFNNHHANAEWTLPSFPTLFTGNYTHGHGFYHPKKKHVIGNKNKTLGQLFNKKGYATFQAGGGWRMSPAYGYSKGFDRTIYRKELDCKEVIGEFFENQQSFPNRNIFTWLNFNDLHHFTKIVPSLQSQLNLSLDYLRINKLNTKKSVHTEYDPTKIEILSNEMKRLDFYLDQIFSYIEKNFSDNEFIVTLATDHGHAFLDNSKNILSVSRNSIPWFIRGHKIPKKISNEITENVDVFQTLSKKCNLQSNKILVDGNLPIDLGGCTQRDYAFAHSIYPNQKYLSTIKDDKYEFFFETIDNINNEGDFNVSPNKSSLYYLNSTEIVNNENLFNKYRDICINNAHTWLKLK